PTGRHDLELDRKQKDQHQAQPEIGHGKSENGAGHDATADQRARLESGNQAGRDADDDREDERHQRKLKGRGHAAENEGEWRRAVRERGAEIAAERRSPAPPELPAQRLGRSATDDLFLSPAVVGLQTNQSAYPITERIGAEEAHPPERGKAHYPRPEPHNQ